MTADRVIGADRSDRFHADPEFEYVRVEVLDPRSVSFVLDDGERLTFDLTELKRALEEAAGV